jgi:hypothetical protein
MDILKEIKKICGSNCEVAFEFDYISLTVWISYDEDFDNEQYVIPITYNRADGITYINLNKWHKQQDFKREIDLNMLDYGIDENEIRIINDVCCFIKSHEIEINETMESFGRKEKTS